jgi:hypothetical protein
VLRSGAPPRPSRSIKEPKPTWVLPPEDTHLMSRANELEF